jgi:hypothetical protein
MDEKWKTVVVLKKEERKKNFEGFFEVTTQENDEASDTNIAENKWTYGCK